MSKYPTDEELELFIKQMEQQELYAPKHVKEQILSQAFPKQTVEVLPRSGSSRGSVQLLSYRLKIIAGMAAAIFMLFLLPSLGMDSEYRMEKEAEGWEKKEEAAWTQEQEEMNANDVLNEDAWQAEHRLNDWFDQISNLRIESLFKMRNGGDLNEN